ncbi:MAG: hypothetical protein V4722_23340 [Bacteroidota bacterium]
MKLQLTILALVVAFFAISQDTSHGLRPLQRNKLTAMKAQDQTQAQQITVRPADSTKQWKNLVVAPLKEKTWWYYTKEFIANLWEDKPWWVVLVSIFLLVGLWRMVKGFFKHS